MDILNQSGQPQDINAQTAHPECTQLLKSSLKTSAITGLLVPTSRELSFKDYLEAEERIIPVMRGTSEGSYLDLFDRGIIPVMRGTC